MRNVFVSDPGFDRRIRATPEPTPAVVRLWIFCVDDEIDGLGFTQERSRNPKNKFAAQLANVESLRGFALTPAPALPPGEERMDRIVPDLRREKEIRLERQKNRRSFCV